MIIHIQWIYGYIYGIYGWYIYGIDGYIMILTWLIHDLEIIDLHENQEVFFFLDAFYG